MPKSMLIQMLTGLLIPFLIIAPAFGSNDITLDIPKGVVFQSAAVASFLVGRYQPHLDEAMDETLICPIGQICQEDPSIMPHAGLALARLVDQQLRSHFNRPIATRTAVRNAETQMTLNPEQDTPLSLAERLGNLLDVDMVVVGTVWRYRERGALEAVPDGGASVAFVVYFIDAASGQPIWRGIYDATQQTVMEDLLRAGKQIRMGLRWLSADELAAHGVREVFRKLPPAEQLGIAPNPVEPR